MPKATLKFSSVPYGIYALVKPIMRSALSLKGILSAAFGTIPMLVLLTMALLALAFFKEDCRTLLFPMPLSSGPSLV